MISDEKLPKMRAFFSHLKSVFGTGVLLLTPLLLTSWLLFQFFAFADGSINILPQSLQPKTLIGFDLPGLGIVLSVLFIYFSGLGVQYYAGRQLVVFTEHLLERVPIVSSIYHAIKQLMETMFSQKGQHFREVVLIEYPRKGIYSYAFLTNHHQYLEVPHERHLISIFLPSTPNPTTGFYLLLPARDVYAVDISVEEAFKIIMSAGIVIPEKMRSVQPLLAQEQNPNEASDTKEDSPMIR